MNDYSRAHAVGSCMLALTLLFPACGEGPNANVTTTSGVPTLPGVAATPNAGAAGAGIGNVIGAAVAVAGSAAPATGFTPVTAATSGPGATPAGAAPGVSGQAAAGGAVAPSSDAWCGVKETLDARCTVCHNEMKVAGAPMSLKTYADLQAPAVSDPTKKVYDLVKLRVHDKTRPMPPQDPLTADQLTSLDAWVGGGAAASADPTCPDNKVLEKAASTWPTNCDETYKIYLGTKENPQSIPAGQEVHPQVMVQPPWGNEEIQAIAWHSLKDNIKVLHHWILYGPSGEFLFGWAPGKDDNEAIPSDVGVYMPGSTMRLDIHYNNVQGTAMEKDASGVEICALKKANFRPKTATTTNALSSFLINVPAKSTGVDVTAKCMHSGQPFRLLSVSPHAHKNAHHMKFTVTKASGQTIVMHDKDFNFEEQTTYPLTPPLEIVSGDQITTTCTFSNDTNQTITFGENTGNEMCFNFALYEPMGAITCGGVNVPTF
jgi:hypothetical protein